jgi:hypothetical protein
MRMGMRRFTRLTNGFSKKVDNHMAAVALHFTHYNFARPHKTLANPIHALRRWRQTLPITSGPSRRSLAYSIRRRVSKLLSRRWIKWSLVLLGTVLCVLLVLSNENVFLDVVLAVLWIEVVVMILTGRNWFREGGFFVRWKMRRAQRRDRSN